MHACKGGAERRSPLGPEPGRLWSLWDVISFKAAGLVVLAKETGRLSSHYSSPGVELTEDDKKVNREELTYHRGILVDLGLPMCVRQVDRLIAIMSDSEAHVISISEALSELANRLVDETEILHLLAINEDEKRYYEPTSPLFGEDVANALPLLIEDISEAGKCLALKRSTAAVFHLMRVMESGVQALGSKLGVVLVDEKVWQIILDQINSAVKSLGKDPAAKLYASAAAHLYTVKIAWRNEVMHPKATYTLEEADAILRAVRVFMNDLVRLL